MYLRFVCFVDTAAAARFTSVYRIIIIIIIVLQPILKYDIIILLSYTRNVRRGSFDPFVKRCCTKPGHDGHFALAPIAKSGSFRCPVWWSVLYILYINILYYIHIL